MTTVEDKTLHLNVKMQYVIKYDQHNSAPVILKQACEDNITIWSLTKIEQNTAITLFC